MSSRRVWHWLLRDESCTYVKAYAFIRDAVVHRRPGRSSFGDWLERGNLVLTLEKPDNGVRPRLEVVVRALRFATWILLGLAFAAVCYAEMFGVLQFD